MDDIDPKLEAELEKELPQPPKPIPQWPIRVALALIPLLCFWEWSWFNKATKKLPIVFFLLCASAFAQPFSGPIPLSLAASSSTPATNRCGPMDATNLTQWLTFDADGNDASGNGHNLSWTGGTPSFSTPMIVSNGVTLNGSEYGNFTPISTSAATWTVMMWVNTTTVAPAFTALYVDDTDVQGIFLFNGQFGVYNAGAFGSGFTLTVNTWYHLAVVDNAGTITFYVNGSSQGTAAYNVSPSFNYFAGRSSGAQVFTGQIDGLVLYSSAKTAADVANVYNAGLPGVTTPGTGCPQQ